MSIPQEPVPIIIWCVPRSCSTAFERAFMQRKDTRSFHEPLGDPFYFSKSRACKRYDDKTCQESGNWDTTVEGVMRSLLEKSSYDKDIAKHKEACRYIFIKDMAQYIFQPDVLQSLHPNSTVYPSTSGSAKTASSLLDGVENPTVLPIDVLRRFKHTFLLRTPQKSIPSYYKCVQEKAAGFEYFDRAEAGFAELKILYDWIANPNSTFNKAPEDETKVFPGQMQAQPQPPPLIDASVLLAHPEHTMSQYCAAVGVPFDPSMLSWESGPVEEFAKWGTYHKGAENSTGFKKETPIAEDAAAAGRSLSYGSGASDTASSGTESDDMDRQRKREALKRKQFPEEVLDTISANMDAYNYLFARRTIKAP